MENITVHSVLAGAYKGAGRKVSAASLLTHASLGMHDAICGKVKPGNLCDVVEDGPPTCPACQAKLRKLAKSL